MILQNIIAYNCSNSCHDCSDSGHSVRVYQLVNNVQEVHFQQSQTAVQRA